MQQYLELYSDLFLPVCELTFVLPSRHGPHQWMTRHLCLHGQMEASEHFLTARHRLRYRAASSIILQQQQDEQTNHQRREGRPSYPDI